MMMTSLGEFAVVVLAAGCSARMGARNKLLEPFGGKPLLAHSLATIASLAPGQLIVVTGHEQQLVWELAVSYGAQPIHNPSYREGMGTSLACGVGAIGAKAQGVFIHLGDVPLASSATFIALASALGADRDRVHQVYAPIHEGRRGHPVLFRTELLPRLSKLSGDEGARRVIGAHSCAEVDVADPGIVADIDTVADLAALSLRAPF